MADSKPEFQEVFTCSYCGEPGVALTVPQCVVGWCEAGHVFVVDPNLEQRYQMVYNFHRDTF